MDIIKILCKGNIWKYAIVNFEKEILFTGDFDECNEELSRLTAIDEHQQYYNYLQMNNNYFK